MKNAIILVLVVVLGISVYMNINSRKAIIPISYIIQNTEDKKVDNKPIIPVKPRPATPKVFLIANANYDDGHLVGGNSQYFDLTISSDSNLDLSKIIITQSSWAVVPNPKPQTSQVENNVVLNKGNTILKHILLAQITNVTINGIVVKFTQNY